MRSFILIPQLHVQNANALSSPYTIGFPAMTSWFGAVHAIERKLGLHKNNTFNFKSFAVLSHDFHLHAYRGFGDHVNSLIGTGNPLNKSGKRSSFIEEAKCNLTVSLLIEVEEESQEPYNPFDSNTTSLLNILEQLPEILHSEIKIAGGDILSFNEPIIKTIVEEKDLKDLKRLLMPSYALIERKELVIEAVEDGLDSLDAILSYLQIMQRSSQEQNEIKWKTARKKSGWLIPIAVGYQGISNLGFAKNQRDPKTQHRFAEAIITLGEFIMPHKIASIDEILWSSSYDEINNLYLCTQKKNFKEA